MTSRLTALLTGRRPERGVALAGPMSLSQFVELVGQSTWGTTIGTSFGSLATYLAENPIAGAAFDQRIRLFKQARFVWQSPNGEAIGRNLELLRNPWPGGTEADLWARLEIDRSRAGNAYIWRPPDPTANRLYMLEPDTVEIIREEVVYNGRPVSKETVGYRVRLNPGDTPTIIVAGNGELAHYAPDPDPNAPWRGRAWPNMARRDIVSDDMMTRHRIKYFEHAATPNLVIKSPEPLTDEQYRRLQEQFARRHEGVDNAYRTLLLEAGADAIIAGKDLRESQFSQTQDAAENRIAVAAGVPASILGIQLGSNPTHNNYFVARRHFGDSYARPGWADACAALQQILTAPRGAERLWYADKHIAYLQHDHTDQADIAQKEAATIRTLIEAGFDPDTVVAAVSDGNWSGLQHSGLTSVQLQPVDGTSLDTGTTGDDEQ